MTSKLQAISGVSSSSEAEVMTIYPSIGSTGLGRMLGSLYDSIPIKINGIKLSYLMFPLPTTPVGLALYSFLKALGNTYQITNRSVKIWQMLLGSRSSLAKQVALTDIDRVEVVQLSGQAFYKAADLVLFGADGGTLLRLAGVPRADVFRATIMKAVAARKQTLEALSQIEARQTA
jgi:hypothetical protein